MTNVSGWVWWVAGVPVNPGGTAVIQAVAIPNTDNGVPRAPGGNGGSEATLQNPGNPTSPNAKTVEGAPDKQPEVVQVHYNKMRLDVLVIKRAILSRTITTQDRFWQRNEPGHDIYDYCEDGMGSQYTLWTVAEWGANGLGIKNGAMNHGAAVCGTRNSQGEVPYAASLPYPGEFCVVMAALAGI